MPPRQKVKVKLRLSPIFPVTSDSPRHRLLTRAYEYARLDQEARDHDRRSIMDSTPHARCMEGLLVGPLDPTTLPRAIQRV